MMSFFCIIGVTAAIDAATFGIMLMLGMAESAALPIVCANLLALAIVLTRSFSRHPLIGPMIKYVLIGVATTIVNYAVYWLLAHPLRETLGIPANNGAWVGLCTGTSWFAAVLFSFFPNKAYVFDNHEWTRQALWREGKPFFASRLLTFGFDLVFMVAAVSLGMNDMLAKIISNIVVVIVNYFASVLIFKREKKI